MTPSDSFWASLNSLYDLKYGILLGIALLVIGLALRSSKRFPNGGIWLALIALGAVISILLQPDAPSGSSSRAWNTKNALCGIAIGGLSWLFHKPLVVKLSAMGKKYLGAGIENGDDTIHFTQTPTTTTEDSKTNEKPN